MSEYDNRVGHNTPILQRVIEPTHPAYLEAKASAEAAVTEAAVPALRVIDDLMEHIRIMPIASRYRTDRVPSRDGIGHMGGVLNPRLEGLNEPEHERESLLIEAESLQSEFVRLGSRLHDLIMRVNASQTE